MRLVIIFCLFSSFIFGQGILPNQIQTSPYSGGFLRSIDKVWDENEQDSVYIYEHVDSSFLANFMTHADSIYISGDTIFLRDGSGFVKLAAGWGLDVSTSGNTVTYKADTSKLATLTDIGGFFTLPTFTAGSVIFSNGTTLAQDNSSLFFDDSNNRLGVLTNSPNYSLDVNGTGWFRQTIYLAGIGANLRMVASGGTLNNANDGGFYTSLSGNIYLGNWDSNRGWVILSGGNIETLGSGNLGVGTSPSYKIHSGGSIGANGTIYALNQGGNFRMKADGTSANDGGFYTSAGGNIYLGNWDGNRGWAIRNAGGIETMGSGTLTITNLAGAGTRMVTASSAGVLGVGVATSALGTVTSIATSSPITGGTITSSGTIGITQSTTSTNGYLSSTDWNAFNNKMDAFYVAASGTAGVGVVGPLDQLTITAGTGITATRSLRNITVSATNTGTVTGTGTANYMTKWSGTSSITNSIMRDDGSTIGLGVAPDASYTFKVGSGNMKIGDNTAATYNKLYFGDGTYVYVGEDVADDRLYLKGSTLSISAAGSLGTSGQVLTSNGTTASWTTPTAAGTVTTVTGTSPIIITSTPTTTPNVTIQNATTAQTGALTSTDWNTFNNKLGGSGTSTRVSFWSGSSTLSSSANLFWDNVNSRLGVQHGSPSYVIHSGGSIGADGTIYALNQGGNFRMKADGTSANDGGFYTSAGGNIYLGNWDSNRGWAILSGGNIETLGSGTLTVTNLAGSGTRMVTASSAGLLSTSAIPTGTVTSIATNNGITGGTITSSGTIGLTGQALAVHNLSSNGLIARTSSGNVSARTITAGTGISVSNGDGVSANPTISTNQSVNYGAIYNSSFYSESWTTGTPKKITMSSTSASSGVSISSSVLTTSSSGDYEISYSVGLQHTSYADWYCACYNSSGSSSYGQTWTTSRRDGTSLRSTLSMSTIVPLSSGDTISLWCYPDTGSGNDSVFYPKLSIKKIN